MSYHAWIVLYRGRDPVYFIEHPDEESARAHAAQSEKELRASWNTKNKTLAQRGLPVPKFPDERIPQVHYAEISVK